MDETSKMYDSQCKNLLDSIGKYLLEMDKIAAEIREKRDIYNIGNFVSYKEFTTRQQKLRILNKKIKECASTIASISDKIEYEESDFTNDINMVKFRAEVTNNTISQSVSINTQIAGQVTTRNVGFTTWDSTNAYLEVHITKDDDFFNNKYSFTLSPADHIVTGGEKQFTVQIPGISNDGVYNVEIYMSNAYYTFDRIYTYQLYVTN